MVRKLVTAIHGAASLQKYQQKPKRLVGGVPSWISGNGFSLDSKNLNMMAALSRFLLASIDRKQRGKDHPKHFVLISRPMHVGSIRLRQVRLGTQFRLSRSRLFARTISFLIMAVMASFGAFPVATIIWYFALNSGLCLMPTRVGI